MAFRRLAVPHQYTPLTDVYEYDGATQRQALQGVHAGGAVRVGVDLYGTVQQWVGSNGLLTQHAGSWANRCI